MGGFEPSLTCLEAVTVGPVPDVRPSGQLSPSPSRPLLWKSLRCVAGAWPAGLAVAFPGEVHLVDESLEITAVLTGDFEPLAISVNEAGVLHLLVDEPGPRRALWVVTPLGVRTLREVLPWRETFGTPLPLAGGDVVVRGPAGLLRIGRRRWEVPLADGGGATALSGDTVLATDGNELITLDDSGRRTVVHHFSEHQLRGPPVIGANGEITVTTRTEVLRLT
jgi:hypothetical protein